MEPRRAVLSYNEGGHGGSKWNLESDRFASHLMMSRIRNRIRITSKSKIWILIKSKSRIRILSSKVKKTDQIRYT